MSDRTPFGSLHLSPVAPSLDAWHSSLGGRVHLSSFVSLNLSRFVGGRVHFSPFVSCFALSPRLDAWHYAWPHLSAFVSLHLSLVISKWTDSFVSLCLPLFVQVVTDSCAVCSAGRRVCLRLRNACLSARRRRIKHT